MADRYWVGGTGTWDGSTTTNWSDISGGVGGASAPTSSDDVFFDALSNATAYTATISTGAVCRDVNVVGPASGNVTLAGTAAWGIYGGLTFPVSGLTRTFTGTINFLATTLNNAITTNGVLLASIITFNSLTGGWILGSSFTNNIFTPNGMNIYAGTFDTAGYNLFCSSPFNSTGNLSRTIYLRNSTIVGGLYWGTNFTGSNLVLDAGTSSMSIGSSLISSNLGQVWHNVTLQMTNGGFGLGGSCIYNNVTIIPSRQMSVYIYGSNTFNNLTIPDSWGYLRISLGGNQTITGTLTTQSSNGSNRWAIESNTIGTTRTITAGAVSLTDVDFSYITAAGGAGTWSGIRIGDAGGNSNIAFTPAKAVYWNNAAGGRWNSTSWALVSGGTPSAELVPLPQDTAIISNTGLNSGATISVYSWHLPNINSSARTLLFTFSIASTIAFVADRINPTFCGNLLLGSSATISDTGILYFIGDIDQSFLPPTSTFANGIDIYKAAGEVTLTGAVATTQSLVLSRGTFNANNYAVTTSSFSSSNTNARTLNLGSSTLTLTGSGTAFNAANSTNLTVTGTGSINMTSASAKTFAGGGKSYPTLNQGGSGNLTITGANTFDRVSNTVYPATVIFPANTTTTVSNFSLSGSSEGQLTMVSSSANTRFTLSKSSGHIAPYNCTIKDSNVVGGATWRAPANYGNVNAGNNLGWNYADIDTKLNNFFFYFEDPIAV